MAKKTELERRILNHILGPEQGRARKLLGVENFKLWGKLGENIVQEGIKSAIQFTIQSTSKGNSLNISALNLEKATFVLTVSNLNLMEDKNE